MLLKILFFIALIYCNLCFARPVSYPDGWTSIAKNNSEMNSILIHYSPTFKYSIGYKAEYNKEKEYITHALNYNHLIKRWNKKHSQANFYTKKGVGILHTDFANYESKNKYTGYIGISSDWETRRYFTSYENRYFHSGKINNYFSQKLKVGVAPYIANYGKFHTWIMFALDHNPEAINAITYSPLLRFFYKTHLVEIGSNNHNKFLFNWTSRF